MKNINIQAKALIEALPYIQKHENKVIVIKYGGSAMIEEYLKHTFAKDISLLRKIGINIIVVHGGGKEITRIASAFGYESKFINGIRYTDEKMMEAVLMGLATINKQIASFISQNFGNAIGLIGGDGMLIEAERLNEELGFVGNITKVNTNLLDMFLKNEMIPVIAPVGVGGNNQFYNINADYAASAIATEMKAEKLIYLSDTQGVLLNGELVSTLTEKYGNELIASKNISGGMIPKVTSAFDALHKGVKKIHFIDGRIEHSLLLELFTEEGIGTEIVL